MILHITTRKDWERALINGEYSAPSLATDGFIHCSTVKQTVDTANLYFKGQNGLVLLCIDENKLNSECKYEDLAAVAGVKHDPRIDNLFPHIYGPINLSAVIRIIDFLPDKDGFFVLPAEVMNLTIAS